MKSVDLTKLTPYDQVTYVPNHANGNAGHPDCEKGAFIGIAANGYDARVFYCKSRKIQITDPANLVLG